MYKLNFKTLTSTNERRDSSVGTATVYALDGRRIGVAFPAGDRYLSLLQSDQTGSGIHPTSYTLSTVGSFPGSNVMYV
jgi:hypothetical protein